MDGAGDGWYGWEWVISMGVADFDGLIDMDLGMSEESGSGMEDMVNVWKLGYNRWGRPRNR